MMGMKKRMKRGGSAKKKRAKAMGGGMMKKRMKAGGVAKKRFPDLSGDGKVTKKDVLMGRGVIKKGTPKAAMTDKETRSKEQKGKLSKLMERVNKMKRGGVAKKKRAKKKRAKAMGGGMMKKRMKRGGRAK